MQVGGGGGGGGSETETAALVGPRRVRWCPVRIVGHGRAGHEAPRAGGLPSGVERRRALQSGGGRWSAWPSDGADSLVHWPAWACSVHGRAVCMVVQCAWACSVHGRAVSGGSLSPLQGRGASCGRGAMRRRALRRGSVAVRACVRREEPPARERRPLGSPRPRKEVPSHAAPAKGGLFARRARERARRGGPRPARAGQPPRSMVMGRMAAASRPFVSDAEARLGSGRGRGPGEVDSRRRWPT
jgi:hypothetical protein